MKQVLLIELNEVNFEAIDFYCKQGRLSTFAELIKEHGVSRTLSEANYEKLEPWIQWVSAHTGLTLSEHGVFRLGDIVQHDLMQIWEELEEQGLKVGAVSPMNAKNRTKDASFFIPDPWTKTHVTGTWFQKKFHDAISLSVNNNAKGKISLSSLIWLLAGAAKFARPANYLTYIKLAKSASGNSWNKALILDCLLHDLFRRLVSSTAPHFASIFFNAAAHIQHHYMLSSPAYSGLGSNPDWYLKPGKDPLFEVYDLYDMMLNQLRKDFPSARILIATGLHQDPHLAPTFYWRLANHDKFLRKINVPFERVEARMSRDFVIYCDNNQQAKDAEKRLAMTTANGIQLFNVDNRGKDLFVMITYPNDIEAGFRFQVDNEEYYNLDKDVIFVAIKNGMHSGVGYFIDTGLQAGKHLVEFPLTSIPSIVKAALAA